MAKATSARSAKTLKGPGDSPDGISSDQVDRLITAIERLSTGTMKEPTGLEAVTMALAGDPRQQPSVANALVQIADALNRIADALPAKLDR